MRSKGYRTIGEFVGRSVPRIRPWGELDLNYKIVAEIDQATCIHCGLCYVACEDGCHQAIDWMRTPQDEFLAQSQNGNAVVRSGGYEVMPGAGGGVVNVFTIREASCVGCNMCSLVCPVDGCITM